MGRALHPRPGVPRRQRAHPKGALPADVADELRRVAKPGEAEEAMRRLQRAAERMERGDARGAVAEATRAKELAPRSSAVREALGLALYRQERFREALSEMQAYRRISGRADQNHIIADCLRATGKPEKAVPLAEEALRAPVRDEAKAEAIIVAASALGDLGRYREALALLRRARTRDDMGRDYVLRLWYVTGDILAKAGRREDAVAEFRKILRHDPGAFDVAERLAQLG